LVWAEQQAVALDPLPLRIAGTGSRRTPKRLRVRPLAADRIHQTGNAGHSDEALDFPNSRNL
jgi:hypothetical protein